MGNIWWKIRRNSIILWWKWNLLEGIVVNKLEFCYPYAILCVDKTYRVCVCRPYRDPVYRVCVENSNEYTIDFSCWNLSENNGQYDFLLFALWTLMICVHLLSQNEYERYGFWKWIHFCETVIGMTEYGISATANAIL